MNAPLPLGIHPREEVLYSQSRTHTIAANAYLYQEGEKPAEMYRIRSGIVCFEGVNERGERCIFHLIGKGAIVGHEALLRQPASFDVRACSKVLVDTISLPHPTDPALGYSMMRWAYASMARLLQDAARFRVEIHRAQAREKVLLLLEQIRKLDPAMPDTCWLPSRSEMADMLDINHVTASRVVARLFRDGMLRRTADKASAQVDWGLVGSRRSVA
jgi:CRP-like cAMP-binding protein